MQRLRNRRGEIVLPKKVANEISQPGKPLRRLLTRYPNIITEFTPSEEQEYLWVRAQPGIHDGEAAAIAIALSRALPIVIDDPRGRTKAENHGVTCLSWQEWLEG